MELFQLRIFSAVAEKKSFSEAARKMYISHSTTSRAVTALEEELGVELVVRGNRVFGLTPEGEKLKFECDRILSIADAIPEKLKKQK